jgi:hypothetical protein
LGWRRERGKGWGILEIMNSVLDGLRERRLRHPVGNVREKRTEIVGCRFEGFRRRRERYVKLSVISIEVW